MSYGATDRKHYCAPRVELLDVVTEKGFSASAYDDWGDAGEAGNIEDGNQYDL